jgi:hypothetical protein
VDRTALELQESLASRPSPLNADGTVNIHVIRPTIGQGLGRHKYTADMLRENAEVFSGWKMYIDHQSPEAKKAAGGLPRSIHDLGGRILESYWDESVPAEGRYGQGAVVARVKPVGQVKKLIEEDPELLEASIRAKATEVHPEVVEGEQVWVVEGISQSPPGSVDWVTEGGAGGRVADLIEGLVVEDVIEPEVPAEGGDQVKQLEEALRDPNSEATAAVKRIVGERTAEALKKAKERYDRELAEAKEQIRQEVRGEVLEEAKAEAVEAERVLKLRDARDEAHRIISEAKLPEKMAARIKRDFDLEGSKLTEDFDAVKASVETDIREAREVLAEVAPTKVEGQGGVDDETPVAPVGKKRFYEELLEEAGIDPSAAYGNNDHKESV